MTKAFKIGIGNLLLEFLAHTLVFLCTLNSARAVTACPLQALFNCLYCFFVGIKCYFHLLTPQFLRRLPLISQFVKGHTVFAICFMCKHKTSRRGVHWTPALMKLFVLCVCYDVMKIVYSNVAVNFQHLYNLIHHKICTVTCKCSSDHLLNCENSN